MIDLAPRDLITIKRLLAKHVPNSEVRAFGSRVTWSAKPCSDLDIVVVDKQKLSRHTLSLLKSEIEESPIPIRIDLLDWHRISPEFQKNIEKRYEIIQTECEDENCVKDWFYRKISDIADVIGGGTPKTSKSGYWGGDVPWLTPKDLSSEHPRYISGGERNITEAGLKNSSAHIVPVNTVLLTSRAPVGYVAIAKKPLATNQGFRNLIVNKNHCPEFVYYLLLHNTDYLKQHASGSTFQELSGNTLKSLEFLIPPLPEQKAIAEILGSLDDKIELNRKMNETLEAIARALFKSWFIDFDPVRRNIARKTGQNQPSPRSPLPRGEGLCRGRNDFSGEELDRLFPSEFEESEMGRIPKGWRVGTIGDYVTVVGGSTPSTDNSSCWNGTHCFCTPKDLSMLSSPVLLDTARKITDEGVDEISSGLLPSGTVLLSSRAPIGYLAMTEVTTAVNQGFIAMICDKLLPNLYVLRWAESNMDMIKAQANGTTFMEVSKTAFRPVPVIVPPAETLAAFIKVVDNLHARVVGNLKENNYLVRTRESLLPKLLSGELRIVKPGKLKDGV